MPDDLKPCPFCGGTDLRLGWVDGYASVGCWKCHVTLEVNQSVTPAAEWNRRAVDVEAVLRVAEWIADRCCCNDAEVPCKYMMEQAAALRKVVGK